MRSRLVARATLVLVLVSCIGIADADVPRKIHYQALLKSPDGELVEGLTEFRIQIFNAETGGESLWNENPVFEVTAGRLDVTLPILDEEGFAPVFFDEMLAAEELWLEINARSAALGRDYTFPRQQILTSGFALRTATIDGARGGTIQGSISVLGDIALPDGIELIVLGGKLIIQSPTSSITMAPDGTLTIDSSQVAITSTGALDISGSDVTISGTNIDVRATARCTVEGSAGLELKSSATLSALGSLVTIN